MVGQRACKLQRKALWETDSLSFHPRLFPITLCQVAIHFLLLRKVRGRERNIRSCLSCMLPTWVSIVSLWYYELIMKSNFKKHVLEDVSCHRMTKFVPCKGELEHAKKTAFAYVICHQAYVELVKHVCSVRAPRLFSLNIVMIPSAEFQLVNILEQSCYVYQQILWSNKAMWLSKCIWTKGTWICAAWNCTQIADMQWQMSKNC